MGGYAIAVSSYDSIEKGKQYPIINKKDSLVTLRVNDFELLVDEDDKDFVFVFNDDRDFISPEKPFFMVYRDKFGEVCYSQFSDKDCFIEILNDLRKNGQTIDMAIEIGKYRNIEGVT